MKIIQSPAGLALGAGLLLAAMTLPATCGAQEADAPGRYQMSEIEGGILRLDTRTGDVSYCRGGAEEPWVCKTAADDRAALDDEIARLEDENRTLRQRVAEFERQGEQQDELTLSLPSDEEMDRVIGFMERLMRRFYAFTRSLTTQSGEET